MNARIIKALVLPLAVWMAGCTQRTIIEEEVSSDEAADTTSSETSSTGTHSQIGNDALYVRSGEAKLGETQSGPFPEPWQQRLGPFPEPWHRDGQDDGKSPPPPSDPSPNPDPNPKP